MQRKIILREAIPDDFQQLKPILDGQGSYFGSREFSHEPRILLIEGPA